MQTDIFTDLAVEAAAQAPADAAGVQSHTAVQGALRITRLEITSQAGEAALGRPQGRYYTAEIPDALGQGTTITTRPLTRWPNCWQSCCRKGTAACWWQGLETRA